MRKLLLNKMIVKKDQSDLQIKKSAKKLEFLVYGLIILVTVAMMLIIFNLILMG
ncbi:MAG: hypothetical protein IPH97_00080 [Ignavibacteriales bacterium]|jgi:hypothetical protein|nr:hypothetical protein [Ignavibacteriales bacterium]